MLTHKTLIWANMNVIEEFMGLHKKLCNDDFIDAKAVLFKFFVLRATGLKSCCSHVMKCCIFTHSVKNKHN